MADTLALRLQAGGLVTRVILDSPQTAGLAEGKADAAIVIGGDGTVRQVAKAMLSVNTPPPPMLLVPAGTANVMGKHLGIDWRDADLAERVLESLRQGRVRQFDVGSANGEPFLVMAGVGIDAHIVHEAHRARKGPITYGHFVWPAARTLLCYPYRPIEVHLDGKLVFAPVPAVAFIGNISEYGTRFPVLPGARPDDGLLDLCVIPVKSPADSIRQFLLSAAGEHILDEGVVYARGTEIRVDSPDPVPVQIDGDPAGFTPVVFSLLPRRLAFIVPA